MRIFRRFDVLDHPRWGAVGKKCREVEICGKRRKGSSPISRVLSSDCSLRRNRRAVIPLGAALPRRSSSLPGSSASHAIAPLFGLAPDGVCRASPVASPAVGSYPTISPLPVPARRPSAVCFLLHCPSPHGARPLAGILLCGARTFLHAHEVRSDCLANFPLPIIRGQSLCRRNKGRNTVLEAESALRRSRWCPADIVPILHLALGGADQIPALALTQRP